MAIYLMGMACLLLAPVSIRVAGSAHPVILQNKALADTADDAKKTCQALSLKGALDELEIPDCAQDYETALGENGQCVKSDNKSACAVGYIAGTLGKDSDKTCGNFKDANLKICKDELEKAKTAAASSDSDSSSTDTGTDADNCAENGVLGLSWLLCPIIGGVDTVVQKTFQPLVENTLKIDPLNGDGSQKGLYDVWNNFRTLANAMLVVAFLVIIFGNIVTL